jgi:L-seryl-tRNA(Ser) seleniumtransferase
LTTLRDLPAVHEVVEQLGDLAGRFPRELIVRETRRVLDQTREALRSGQSPAADINARVRDGLEALARPSLRRVINATGVVLHTNLGRAPLGANPGMTGYSNLEYDLAAGERGRRDVHIASLLEQLVGAPGIAVNNNAAAVYLALNELAAGGEVIVSRGELIEIGDGFRIPDIMARSGAVLREVGTTNRTHIGDYRDAVNDRTRLLMIVHPSNFRIEGFTAKPTRSELAAIAHQTGIPLYEDLGSGCLADLRAFGIDEPRVQESIAEGVALVSFSGDKLLGGPQAGVLAGQAALIARLRRNPMFRALRLDKLILGALETVLRYSLLEQWDRIPALRMIALTVAQIKARSEALILRLGKGELVEGASVIGGGSTPEQSIPTWLISIRTAHVNQVERALREHHPPVIARIEEDCLILDLRTVAEEEEPDLLRALQTACGAG